MQAPASTTPPASSSQSPPASVSAAPPSAQDKAWMTTAKQAGLTEIEAGKLAQQQGSDNEIRQLGQMLVKDHTLADKKLSDAAKGLNVELPTKPSDKQVAEGRELRKTSGRLFDRDFVAAMTKGHQEAIAAAEKEQAQGYSPPVKALAQEMLPTLKRHLAMFQQADGN
ncbi:DUF4142 domain-containing protein [Actinomadura hibisca]|uniref:DUF4142 domain-containing protein n=1 Tax=Actinomadura hibisca TaxID=68565 RepID=UPI000B193A5B|nr:DUF4142 domain-containing protein [Actinomadura hibisca]